MDPAGGLSGQTVLLTRPNSKFVENDKFGGLLTANGAEIVAHPVIELRAVESDSGQLARTLTRLEHFQCLVFFSATGVNFFGELINKQPISPLEIGYRTKIAAVGRGTADALREIGLSVDIVPERSNSASFAEALLHRIPGPYLLVRGSRGSDVFVNAILANGQQYEEMTVYESVDVDTADNKVLNLLRQNQIDWVTLTSSAIARSTVNLFGELLKTAKLVSISPDVSLAARTRGFHVHAEAKLANFRSMIEAMMDE